jgi:hypothetical protein
MSSISRVAATVAGAAGLGVPPTGAGAGASVAAPSGGTAGGGGAMARSAITPPDSAVAGGIPDAIIDGLAADSAPPTFKAALPPQPVESSNRGAISADPKPGSRGLIMLL